MRFLTIIITSAIIAVLGIGSGCTGGTSDDVRPDSVYVADVYRTMYLYGRTDSAGRDSLANVDTTEVNAFMTVVGETPVTDLRLQGWSWALPTLVFTPAVDSIYPTGTDSLALAIGGITARMRHAGVELTPRRYAAVVWGRMESMMFVDSVMLIALNHYLGAEYDGYSHFPLYMRLTKEPRLLPYDIAEALIATDYPYNNPEGTLLQRMLYEGALTAAKLQSVGSEANLADALGYRPEQMQFITDNEKELWRRIVADGLLYDTSTTTIDRLIAPAPNVSMLDPRCPGRLGRYLGYRIVENFCRKNPEATLPYLLSSQFYTNPDILAQSDYNP